MKDVSLNDSSVPDTAKIGDHVTLIRSTLGEQCMVGSFSKLAYSTMGDFSYIGEYSMMINATVGKFCSISWGVSVGPEEHDYTRVTNHSFLYSTKSFTLVDSKQYSPFTKECCIGNDVWIGCNTTILRGVTIGDGAVIGANSLVNKSVPPYAIVVGSPAKVIKFRFESELIAALLKLRWWDLPVDIIRSHAELFAQKPTWDLIEKMRNL